MSDSNNSSKLSILPLGGVEDVTKNLYVYEYNDEILLVDCGIGFADETMLGVDILLPDVNYLLNTKKKIVGMALTHGHEDHIGALPFVLPQLPEFPVYGSPLTALMSNDKLKSFGQRERVKAYNFGDDYIELGSFKIRFLHVTHSIPDASHIVIKTPVGNLYHGADFKFDEAPYDNKLTELEEIKKIGEEGVLALFSDCLGSTRKGKSESESALTENFVQTLQKPGRAIVTTYSSNINRLNQIIDASRKSNRKVALFGRSLLRIKALGQELGYLQNFDDIELSPEMIKANESDKVTLIVAGSQAQENSALMRMTNGEHRDIQLKKSDMVILSSDVIPGNEITVYSMIDDLLKKVNKVYYKDLHDNLHVSGHGNQDELMELVNMLNPKFIFPISGMYHQMSAYQDHLLEKNIDKSKIFLLENGQKVIINDSGVTKAEQIKTKNIYVDEFSQEKIDHYILHDRERLSKDGMVILVLQIQSDTGKLNNKPDVITRGINFNKKTKDNEKISNRIYQSLNDRISSKHGIVHIRKTAEQVTRRVMRDMTGADPLVMAVVLEI